MSDDEKIGYVRYRLETARKTLDAAAILAENAFWNSAVNRLYYAAFYAVSALLVYNGFQAKSHSAIKSLFSQHFVKTGLFERKHGRLLAELFDSRQKGDYEDIFDFDAERVQPLFAPVQDLINVIEQHISTSA